VAQRNRRRARSGGGTAHKPSAEGEHVPGPLESGEEQLTEAQLAFGRPEPAETPNETELTEFEESDAGHGNGSGNGGLVSTGGNGGHGGDAGAVSHGARENYALRLIGFVQGSWRELQRVQWPDRPQVFQATGVVLGFVIVAGAFLGGASWAAEHIVNLILYGHG
jgi:preprotein translocase subunit SecE